MTDNTNTHTNSGNGELNSAQGDGAKGKEVNNYYGVSEECLDELKDQLSITKLALRNFFKIMEKQQVPPDDLDSKLREIAAQYKELLLRLDTVQSEDPQVVKLKQEAKQAIEVGDYAKAEELLNQAEARDMEAIEQLEASAKQRRISAAASCANNASLQKIQLRYAKAAEYWRKAADLLPKDKKKDRSLYLDSAGNDLYRIAKYKEALPLFEQSLSISQEIGERAGEGVTLSNIGTLHHARGDYATALKYLEHSLSIHQEIGDRDGEGATLNNISQIYDARGDYDTALKYLEQSLSISQKIGD